MEVNACWREEVAFSPVAQKKKKQSFTDTQARN